MTPGVIRFTDVVKRFGDVVALSGLSFSAPARGCLGLLGPNGAGKTTALKALLGLTRIDSGRITSEAATMGYLPQQPALFGWMTASEYLEFVGRSAGLRDTSLKEAAGRWLDRLGLAKSARRRISGFSGGMKQRLGIAAALLQDPEVLVLDEPVSSLDPVGRHEILGLIDSLKSERSIIMSTHILNDAERVSDDVVILHEGRAVLQESMAELQAELAPQYEVELSGDLGPASVQAALAEQEWVGSVHSHGAVVTVVLREGDDDVARLLRLLGSLIGAGVIRVERTRVSLEDVFLQLVSPS